VSEDDMNNVVQASVDDNETSIIDLLLDTIRSAGKVTDTHLKIIVDETKIEGTNTTVHTYRLPLDAHGRVRYKPLADYLRDRILDYAIPRRRIKEAAKQLEETGSAALIGRLQYEALQLFTSLKKSGEGGELLVFAFAEAVFGLSQIICKMSLKTSSEMHYHGADGVYAEGTSDGLLKVYWGESKLYGDASTAVRDCLNSLAPFLTETDGSVSTRSRDIFLINEFANFNDPQITEGLKKYFDMDDPKSLSLEHCGIALIGFDNELYPKDGMVGDDNQLGEMLKDDIPKWIKQIENRIGIEKINNYDIHFICVPMRTVSEFREYFLSLLGVTK
jgi:hypothetical protein